MQNNDVIGQFEAALINVSSELVDANKWTLVLCIILLRLHLTIKAPTAARREPDLEMTSNREIWKKLPV